MSAMNQAEKTISEKPGSNNTDLEAQIGSTFVTVAERTTTIGSNDVDASPLDNAQDTSSTEDEVPLARYLYIIAHATLPTFFLMGAIALGIPLAVFMTVRHNSTIGSVPTSGLVIWLFAGWCCLFGFAGIVWSLKRLCERAFDPLKNPFNAAKGLVVDDLQDILVYFLTLCVLYGISERCLCTPEVTDCNATWVPYFCKAILATLVICAVCLAKSLILEALYLRNAKAFLTSRSMQPLLAWQALLPEVKSSQMDRIRQYCGNLLSAEPVSNARLLALYIRGEGDDEFYERVGCLKKALLAANRESEGANVNLENVRAKLVDLNDDARIDGDAFRNDRISYEDFMDLFDTNRDQEVSMEECLRIFYNEIIPFFRDCNRSVLGIKKVMSEVDNMLLIVVVPLAAIIYAAFFVNDFGKYATPLWTTLTGLSFAISGTVTQFVAACSFVFGKQPYDVGDRVSIMLNSQEQDLIVLSIHLHYSVFRRLKDSTNVQISHQALDALWITNLSRSKDLRPNSQRTVRVTRERLVKNLDKWQWLLRERIAEDEECRRHLDAQQLILSRPSQSDGGDELCQVILAFAYQKRIIRRETHLAACRERVWKMLQQIIDEDAGFESREGLVPDSAWDEIV